MFGRKAREIVEANKAVDRLAMDFKELNLMYQSLSHKYKVIQDDIAGTRKSLVLEIEARIASEDATNILASVLCDLVRKKRSKKKG